eukprot:416288-Pleurochrysis_carterae.AAC.1
MPAVNVLGPRVVLRVVRHVNRRLVVEVQGSRAGVAVAELVEQGAKVSSLLCGLGGSDNLRLARRKGDCRLLFAAPRDRSPSVDEDVTRR